MKFAKKKLFFFLFIITTAKIFATSENYSFSMGADTGVIYGTIYELVFDFDSSSNPYVLSRLDWDFKNIQYTGWHADFVFNHFYSDINFKAGIPGTYGTMNDYDWLDYNDTSKLTNHSWHTNVLSSYTKLNFNAGWKFFLPAKITLTPLIGFEAEDIFFIGYDGSYKYLNNDGVTYNEGTFKGKVISYEQTYKALKFGFLAETTIVPHMDFGFSFFICPAFDIDGVDHHFRRNIYFWDNMVNGIMYEGNAKIAVLLLQNHVSLGIDGGIQYIPIMSGKTYNHKEGKSNWEYSYGLGGTKRFLWQLGTSVTFIL